MTLPVLHSVEAVRAMFPDPKPTIRWIKKTARQTGKCCAIGRIMVFTDEDAEALRSRYSTRHIAAYYGRERPTYIYFIRCRDRIKIGIARNPEKRLAHLKIGCPYPVALIRIVPGKPDDEYEFHQQFAHLREHGEWFRLEGDLAKFLHIAEGK